MENLSFSGNISSSHDHKFLKASRGHESPEQLSCVVCGKSFNRKSDLTRHMKIHTGEKPFTCNECGKCFIQKCDLIKHLRVHTGEKPFSCSKCRMCYSDKSSLKRHQRIHTGWEQPMSYNKCWKDYKDKIFLKIHGRVHDEKKKISFREMDKGSTVCSCSKNNKTPIGEKSRTCYKCGRTSSFKGGSDCQEKSHMCVSYCKLSGEGLKECGCHNKVYQMASGDLDDDVKNVNLLQDTGKELHEVVSVKNEIDIDEFPSESQVSEEFEFISVKNEVESD